MAKNWFKKYKIKFDEVSLDDDNARQTFYEAVGSNVKSVPQIYVDDVRIGGYQDLLKSDFAKQVASGNYDA